MNITVNNKFKEKLNEIDNIEFDILFLENEQQILTNNTKLSEDSPKSGAVNGKNQQNNNQNSKNKKEKKNQHQENKEDKMSKYANYLKSHKKEKQKK